MRGIPATTPSSGKGLRPLLAVLLGVLLLGGVFLATTAGSESGPAEPTEVAVTVTAEPVDEPGAGRQIEQLDSFPIATPVHRAVTTAIEADSGQVVSGSVSDATTVGLESDAEQARFVVERQGGTQSETRYVLVNVERT